MPRRPAADIPSVAELDRPKPPVGMSPEAAAIWNCVVGSMRPGWIGPEAFAVLGRYCFAESEAARLEVEMTAMPMTNPARVHLVKQYKEMSTLALSYGRSLRLTPKGNTPRDGRDNGHGFEARDRGFRRQIMPYDL
jgi:hypothetical protein